MGSRMLLQACFVTRYFKSFDSEVLLVSVHRCLSTVRGRSTPRCLPSPSTSPSRPNTRCFLLVTGEPQFSEKCLKVHFSACRCPIEILNLFHKMLPFLYWRNNNVYPWEPNSHIHMSDLRRLTPQEVHPGVCAEHVRGELHAGRSEADREAACITGAADPQH